MSKHRDANPQPTGGTPYDIYLWPRSKTQEKQRLYDFLRELGWRFDAVHMRWHTPEDRIAQSYGRLEWATDFTWARVQPPNKRGFGGAAEIVRRDSILELVWKDNTWEVVL